MNPDLMGCVSRKLSRGPIVRPSNHPKKIRILITTAIKWGKPTYQKYFGDKTLNIIWISMNIFNLGEWNKSLFVRLPPLHLLNLFFEQLRENILVICDFLEQMRRDKKWRLRVHPVTHLILFRKLVKASPVSQWLLFNQKEPSTFYCHFNHNVMA